MKSLSDHFNEQKYKLPITEYVNFRAYHPVNDITFELNDLIDNEVCCEIFGQAFE